jgi:hypothetical protein
MDLRLPPHRPGGSGPRPPGVAMATLALALALGCLGPLPVAAEKSGCHRGHDHRSHAGPILEPVHPLQAHPELEVDMENRTLTVIARAHPEAFKDGLPPDHQYHGLVHIEGGAAARSLFTTAVPDSTIARVFRAMGADDGGGVPMAAWNLRWVPFVPQPSARVKGTPVSVTVEWEGSGGAVPLSELLQDPGGQGIDLRFGGNEEHDDEWHSGCIFCLYSCPGGVISNAAYSIRDHQRGDTLFLPTDRMPPEGTRVRITFVLDST